MGFSHIPPAEPTARRWLLCPDHPMRIVAALAVCLGLLWLGSQVSLSPVVLLRGDERERVEGSGWPRVLVDAYGERTTLPRPPRRIVSVMLAADEMIADLVPRERIAGVTMYAADPLYSNCAARVRGLPQISSLDVERVLPLQPDLVLAARFSHSASVQTLQAAGVPVFRFGKYDSLADIRENVVLLGQVLDAEPQAHALVTTMDRTLAEVRARARGKPPVRVLYYNGGWTAGTGTLFDEMLHLAGGVNVAAEAGLSNHTTLATELALALDPEVLVFPVAFTAAGQPSYDPRAELQNHPAWQGVTAVRRGRLHLLPAQHIACVSHHAVQGALDLVRVLHKQ